MAKHLPVTTPGTPPVRYYPTPATAAPQLLVVTPARLAAFEQRQQMARRAQRVAYARWRARQAVLAERDRRARRFMLGAGAVSAVVVLGVLAGCGWWAYHQVTRHSGDLITAAMAVGAIVGGLCLLGALGHRCVTIVQHWH